MLDTTLEKKPDDYLYKMWLSKQHTGSCGTRLQVSYYKGLIGKQAWCPNCGRIETAARLCLCPSEDRTKLFLESTDELQDWRWKDCKIERELAYWIPNKCVLMTGTKNMAEIGCTYVATMASLAKSQDIIIGWKNFMEGWISRHCFDNQNEYLILGNHRMNSGQWIKQFISKILHITHSQWIFGNFTLRDIQKGWSRRKELHKVMEKIDQLRETNIDDISDNK